MTEDNGDSITVIQEGQPFDPYRIECVVAELAGQE